MNPLNIQIIGTELCIVWEDGAESYFPAEFLRRHSPSAQNIGEKDIFGVQYGGSGPKDHKGVKLLNWEIIGNYAMRPNFSDGHSSGIYSWDYLRNLPYRSKSS